MSKVHNKPIKRPRKGFKQESKRQPERHPSLAHRTVRCATGQCPVHQGTQLRTAHLREFWKPLRYNSPDCPVHHRTVRCASGATTTPRATVDCNALNARLHVQRTEDAQLAHRTAQRPHKSELQRSNPNGLMTWLAHWTVQCAMRQHTSNDHFWWLGL